VGLHRPRACPRGSRAAARGPFAASLRPPSPSACGLGISRRGIPSECEGRGGRSLDGISRGGEGCRGPCLLEIPTCRSRTGSPPATRSWGRGRRAPSMRGTFRFWRGQGVPSASEGRATKSAERRRPRRGRPAIPRTKGSTSPRKGASRPPEQARRRQGPRLVSEECE